MNHIPILLIARDVFLLLQVVDPLLDIGHCGMEMLFQRDNRLRFDLDKYRLVAACILSVDPSPAHMSTSF